MAKSFIVEGARKSDGAEQSLVIEADDAEQAEQIGNVRGLFVSSCRPAADPAVRPVSHLPPGPSFSLADRLKSMSARTKGVVAGVLAVCLAVGGWRLIRAKSQSPTTHGSNASENQLKSLALLKRLQSKVEVGMQFADYNSSLANTWADVKSLVDMPDSGSNAQLGDCLAEVIDDYKSASESWNQLIAPGRDDEDRRLEVEAAQIEAMHEGPAQRRARVENEIQTNRKALITSYQNKLKRQTAFSMADAAIIKADAVVEGDGAKEAQAQALILKFQAELKADIAKSDDDYLHPKDSGATSPQ